MAEIGRATLSSIDPEHFAALIDAVRNKRQIEHDARVRVENAHTRLKLAIDSRTTAESRLFDYVSGLSDPFPIVNYVKARD